jgi:AbrB family looped-hinge helix DNA binding protein
MDTLATTRMSSKGQVVIPEAIRNRLQLKEGAEFIVIGDGDVVILKAISPPNMEDFDALLQQAHQQAKAAGMKRSDITKAINEVRGRK